MAFYGVQLGKYTLTSFPHQRLTDTMCAFYQHIFYVISNWNKRITWLLRLIDGMKYWHLFVLILDVAVRELNLKFKLAI